jgi:ATP-binding cassette subfamily B protein
MLGFVFMLMQNFSFMKVPVYMRRILDEICGQNQLSVIKSNILRLLLFTLLLAVSLFLMRKLIIGVSRKIEYQFREKIFKKLLSLDYLFFQNNETGDLISRCTNDLNHVRTLLGPGVMYIPDSLSRLILFLPVLIGLSGSLMLIIGLIMLSVILLIVFLLPLLRPIFSQIQETMGSISNFVWQSISGISTIKYYTAEGTEINRFKDLNELYIKKHMAMVKLRGFLRPFFFFTFSLSELVILLVGGKQVINGQMTIGELLQFNIMVSLLTFPVLSLGWIMALIQQGLSALVRINYILDQPEKDKNGQRSLPPGKCEYSIRNLTYKYPGHTEEVLKNVNMEIKSGMVIGITGEVGSGKSTLLNIISGLIKPSLGQVYVNGVDILDIQQRTIFEKVSMVSQDPFLFSKTVAENIALGFPEMSIETVEQAVENAGLTKDIKSFPEGLNQEIGERGITLSVGQRQRVAIARALSKCAPILILDDPLSNIDARTETTILNNLRLLDCYVTLIIVSQRISGLKFSDIIYVFKDGMIKEEGNHTQLMRKRGYYSRLASLQQMEMELKER